MFGGKNPMNELVVKKIRTGRLPAMLSIITIVFAGCANQNQHVTELSAWMTGSFSSAAQAERDAKNYFDIRLETVRIWPQRADGIWLYVEQAAATRLDKPYRQRVYHVHARDDQTLASVVYTLPEDPLQYAGAWRTPAIFDELSPADLTEREGCAIILAKQSDGSYSGSTHEKDCQSELRGASYATSDVVITPAMLKSWDRGYNQNDEQVWGATEGPYEFIKLPQSK